VIALRGVGFEIEPGEAVAILGANGAGKSTLLRLLAGLSRPSAGELVALREAAEGAGDTAERDAPGTALSREALRREVGYVGHATLLYGELTARENLVFAARLHGGAPERGAIDALLDEFGLLEVADRRAGTFSRGMAQRLSIARAIVHGPRVLLLDEPFTGLDQTSADRLSARLAGLRAGGRTLILVTHDPARAVEIGDRALVLHRGAIRARPGRGDPGGEAFEPAALQALLARLAHGVETGAAA
jgi:heme exporter protein A